MEIELDDRWSIGGRPHGGYLLREAVRPALSDRHPDPLVVSAHFLRSPDPGTADVQVEVLRTGKRVTQLRTRLLQHGETVLDAQVTTTALEPGDEPHWSQTAVPELPPLEDCRRTPVEPVPGFRIGHLEFVDVRNNQTEFGRHPTPGTVSAHVQMATGPTTPLDLLVLADALQPTAMGMGIPGWFPTIELTVYVRAIPAEGWLVGRQRTQELIGGWFDEDCDLWDSRGRLVCQARQLAGYRLST